MGGFSESGHYIYVLSNVCAFVLMWCLFVGNSRQTTSSVPRHRAPKYERKLNSHLTLKRFLLKRALVSCMRRKQVCATSSETTVWLQEGESEQTSESESFPGQSALTRIWIHFSQILDCEFYWMVKPFCVCCGLIFNAISVNQTRTPFLPRPFVIFQYLDSSCQSTHGAD